MKSASQNRHLEEIECLACQIHREMQQMQRTAEKIYDASRNLRKEENNHQSEKK